VNCAEARDLAPELALGILGGAERAEVLLHVNDCARCQVAVAEFTEVADALPLLAPEAEPSAGFEERVLAALDAPKRSNRRRWISAVAVAAAAAAIVSITLVRVIESGDDGTTVAQPATNPVVATMVGGRSGQPAGWVSVSDHRAVTVAVDYGIPAGIYRIRVQHDQGSAITLGEISVDGAGRGFWAGNSNTPIGPNSTITLVADSGEVTCHGSLGNPQ
jgi:hypothetical protein